MNNRLTGFWKKLTALVLAVLLLGGQLSSPQLPGVYEVEAAQHWAEPYMYKLNAANVMYGDKYGNMNPDRPITRAEFVSMINRSFNYESTGENPFRDVSGNEWYANDIVTAFNQGYFTGESNTRANPDSYLTREQAVALLTRNIKYDSIPLEDFAFVDSWDFNEWSRDAINIATKKNFIAGYNDGTFRPSKNITRGEAAKLIATAAGELLNSPGEKSLGYTPGNVMISSSGATLRNTTVGGDLYITSGVGLGELMLENVIVNGEVIIMGAGASNAGDASVVFKDCQIKKMTIDGPEEQTVAIKVDGSTEIKDIKVKSSAIIEELSNKSGGVRNVTMQAKEDDSLWLQGVFDKVTVKAPKQFLHLGSGEIMELVIDEEAPDSEVDLTVDSYVSKCYVDVATNIIGDGDIGYIKINAMNTTVKGLPDEIEITPGYTANINGQVMNFKDALTATSSPKILNKYPEIEQIGSTQATALYQTNKEGTIYWAITETEDYSKKLPREDIYKPDQVRAIAFSGSVSAKLDEEVEQAMSGLKQDTKYTVHAFLLDDYDQKSPVVTETFKTGDTTIPKFIDGHPKVNTTTDTTADIDVIVDKDATVHWAVYERGRSKPTATDLKRGHTDGSIASGSVSCSKNELATFQITGLEELKDYELHAMATDGDNDSAVTTLSFTTRDVTPPKFVDPYPRSDKITPNSVVVQYMTNENATVYYIALKRGAEFPPIQQGQLTPPDINSDEAKQLVKTGNNALQNGSGAAQANTEGMVTVGNLEPEKSYDVYMVAEDAAGNMSEIKSLTIRTTDTIPPTVTQEFMDMIDEVPTATGEIRIVFSEEVLDTKTRKNLTTASLKENMNIILYDMSAPQKVTVDFNFDAIQVIEQEGQTIVSFPDAAIDLKSGNKYQFEISGIVDTVGNKLVDKTLLPVFTTVAPLVELIRSNPPETPKMDMTFRINPTSNDTADDIMFDLLFYTDKNVTFELWRNEGSGWKAVQNERPNQSGTLEITCWAKNGVSLGNILSKQSLGTEGLEYIRFSGLKAQDFGIRFVSIESNRERSSWNSTVNMEVRSLIGAKNYLDVAANDPAGNYNTALQQGAIEVHYPKDFKLMATFMDVEAPKFLNGFPNFGSRLDDEHNPVEYPLWSDVGDGAARAYVSTDKACTVYYLVAPRTSFTGKEPDAMELINQNLKPSNGIYGEYEVLSGNVRNDFIIQGEEGLMPDTEYRAYFVLKGTPANPSKVSRVDFCTQEANPPIMTNPKVAYSPDGQQAIVTFYVNKTSTIDWIVYPSDLNGGPQSGRPDSDGQETNIQVTPENIREQYSDGAIFNRLMGGRTEIAVAPGVGTSLVTITVTGMEQGLKYNLFAVAKGELSNKDSDILVVRDMTPTDRTPPKVQVVNMIYNDLMPPLDANGNPDTTNGMGNYQELYNGSVTLIFSEGAYYYASDDVNPSPDDEKLPLTVKAFVDNLQINAGDTGKVEEKKDGQRYNGETKIVVTGFSTNRGVFADQENPNIGAIKTISLAFINIRQNSTVTFPKYICDVNNNVTGKLKLIFENNENLKDPNSRKPGKTELIGKGQIGRLDMGSGWIPSWY